MPKVRSASFSGECLEAWQGELWEIHQSSLPSSSRPCVIRPLSSSTFSRVDSWSHWITTQTSASCFKVCYRLQRFNYFNRVSSTSIYFVIPCAGAKSCGMILFSRSIYYPQSTSYRPSAYVFNFFLSSLFLWILTLFFGWELASRALIQSIVGSRNLRFWYNSSWFPLPFLGFYLTSIIDVIWVFTLHSEDESPHHLV